MRRCRINQRPLIGCGCSYILFQLCSYFMFFMFFMLIVNVIFHVDGYCFT